MIVELRFMKNEPICSLLCHRFCRPIFSRVYFGVTSQHSTILCEIDILLIHVWISDMENRTSKVFLKTQSSALSYLGTRASNDGVQNPWSQIPPQSPF